MVARAPRPRPKSAAKAAGSGGTAARRPASGRSKPAERRGSAESKRPVGEQRLGRSTSRIVVLLLVIGALVVSFGSSLRAYLRQSDQIHQLQAQIAASEASIAATKEQQKRWQDPAYIEQQARLRFGWVMPGQTPYVVLGSDGQPLNSDSVLNAEPPTVQSKPVAWWSKAAASLEDADNPPPPTVKKPAPLKRIDRTP